MLADAPKKPIPKPDKVTLQWIPDGVEGTRATLKIMCRIVKDYKKVPDMRHLALSAARKCGGKDWVCEVAAIQEWVKRHITYRKDIDGIETLQTPMQTIAQGVGDCDDQSILVATLLACLGHPSRFVAFAFQPGEFAHVLTETRIGDNWVSVETTEPVGLGWQPAGVVGRLPYYI